MLAAILSVVENCRGWATGGLARWRSRLRRLGGGGSRFSRVKEEDSQGWAWPNAYSALVSPPAAGGTFKCQILVSLKDAYLSGSDGDSTIESCHPSGGSFVHSFKT